MSGFTWPHALSFPVAFRDLDAMGHVNNAVYLAYLEQVRNEAYLAMLGRCDPLDPTGGLDFVVARAEVDYLIGARYGDVLTVSARPERIGRSSWSMTYEGHLQDGRTALRARTVLVAYDWDARASKPLSDAVVAALKAGLAA
jgi:acyl-CoA thioester hydrolase